MKQITIYHCANCPWNEHGSTDTKEIEIDGKMHLVPGDPILYCLYDTSMDFRDNVRQLDLYTSYKEARIIVNMMDKDHEKKFEKQLTDFPDWCPLSDFGERCSNPTKCPWTEEDHEKFEAME